MAPFDPTSSSSASAHSEGTPLMAHTR
jgi:hypothetical protein